MTSESSTAANSSTSPFGSLATVAWHVGALVLVGLLLFSGATKHQFVYGEIEAIANNQMILTDEYPSTIFTPQGAYLAAAVGGYYAPITELTYVMDARMFYDRQSGLISAAGVHATNIAIYLAVCVLAYLLLLLLTRLPRLSALAALFFLVHPMHAENVNYVASRSDTLSAMFVLLTLLIAWSRPNNLSLKVTSAIALFFTSLFAVLSGPVGLVAPILLLLVDVTRRKLDGVPVASRWPLRYGPIAVALVLWAVLHVSLFGTLGAVHVNAVAEELSATERLLLPFQILFRYFTLSIFPYPMTVIYNPLTPGENALLVNGIVAILLLVALAGIVLLASRKISWLGFGALWFVLGILPYLYYLPLRHVLAESRLLLPSLGICLILARLLYALGQATRPLLEGTRNTVAAVVGVLLLTLFAAMSFTRSNDWKTAPAFWDNEARLHPNDELVLANQGFYLTQAQKYGEAEKTFRKAFENYRTRHEIYYELAYILINNRKQNEARAILDKALALNGRGGDFYSQVGLHYELLQEWQKARSAYEKAVSVEPQNMTARFNLGNIMMTQKKYDQAIEQYTKAAENAPAGTQNALLINRSIAYRQIGKLDLALADAEKLREVDLFEPRAYTMIAAIKLEQMKAVKGTDKKADEQRGKLLQDALDALQDGIENIPTPDRTMLKSIAHLEYQMGFREQAINHAINAVQADQSDLRSYIFLGTLLMDANKFRELGMLYVDLMQKNPAARKEPTIVAGLGYAFLQGGDTEQAKKLCEQALKTNMRNPMALLLYKKLADRKVAVDADLSELGPNIYFPSGPPTPGDAAIELEGDTIELERR